MTTPDPVRFDHGASQEAVRQILVTAESMIEMLSVMETDHETVTEDWTGRFREVFDSEYETTVVVGAAAVEMLYQMAMVIQARSTEATAAANLYERWLAEQGDP